MNEEIKIGDRYECIDYPHNGFTKNKIYDVFDVGKYIWFFNDEHRANWFTIDRTNKYFRLLEKAK